MRKNKAISMRKPPKQQRAIVLVESILQASAHILEEGKEPFTTNHIAQKAGVSIGSLYQYFPGADAIMATLIEKHVEEERAAAQDIIAAALAGGKQNMDVSLVLRDLLEAFVRAHSSAPRLTARLHAMAPGFGLQEQLDRARDEQAMEIARSLGLEEEPVIMVVMAIEGVVLATLARNHQKLGSGKFMDQLYRIALSLLDSSIANH